MAWSSNMNTSNQYIKYQIGIELMSQNIEQNTSNVNVYVKAFRTNTGYNSHGSGVVYCKIDGVTYSQQITNNQYINENGIILFSQNVNIVHGTTGTKTLTCSAWFNHYLFTSDEQSYSENLTTIPRATTPTVSPSTVVLNNDITISLPRASSNFTHNLRYVCKDLSGVIAEGVETECTWHVPMDLATQIPIGSTGTCSIVCYTFSNGVQVGSKTVHFGFSIHPNARPSINNFIDVDLNGYKTTYGNSYIQNKSKMKLTVDAGATYGSTIESITCKIGEKYQATNKTGVFETNVITESDGVKFIDLSVTDARGLTSTARKAFNVIEYTSPTISKFTARRCTEDGTPSDEGAFMKIEYAGDISDVSNMNSKRFIVQYKPTDASTWTTAIDSTDAYTVDSSVIVAADTEKVYNLKFQAIDDFETVSKTWNVSTAFTLVDFKSNGKGIAFGKVSEIDNAVEISSDWCISYEGKNAPFVRTTDAFGCNGFSDFWQKMEALMKKTKSNTVICRVNLQNMSVSNGWYFVWCSCNNFSGNGQYDVQGTCMLMNSTGMWWAYTTGGATGISSMGFYPKKIG